ncbi:MAG: hypothetical protein GXO89_06555 [Chlorobi bacterium]|nr:hypothetical protein [Chlorobiota bacterium]
MKKAIIISIVIFISISTKLQVYETWSAPIALTDSSSYNSNPLVAIRKQITETPKSLVQFPCLRMQCKQ